MPKALRPGAIRIIDIEFPDMYGHCLQSWFVVIGTKSLAPWSSVLSTTWGQQAELASWLASSRRSWVFTEGLEIVTQYDRKQSLCCLHHRRILSRHQNETNMALLACELLAGKVASAMLCSMSVSGVPGCTV